MYESHAMTVNRMEARKRKMKQKRHQSPRNSVSTKTTEATNSTKVREIKNKHYKMMPVNSVCLGRSSQWVPYDPQDNEERRQSLGFDIEKVLCNNELGGRELLPNFICTA